MRGKLFLAAILTSLLPNLGTAQSVKLKGYEIDALLSGNTAVGIWEGTPYRQFFDDDGTTVYAQPDTAANTVQGAWRIDPDTDSLQSIGPHGPDWQGWFVMEWDGDFYWVSKTPPPTPFEIFEGQQLVFP